MEKEKETQNQADFHIKMPRSTFEALRKIAFERGSNVRRELNILALNEIKRFKIESGETCS